MATNTVNVVTQSNLVYYDTKLKAWVVAQDEQVLADAKAYADSLADNYDPAGTAQTKVDELANGQVKTNTETIAALQEDVGDVDNLQTTNKTVVAAINETLTAIGTGGTASVVTVTTDTTTDGYLKSYTIKQGENTVGVIDIPKDMVVTSGEVVVNPEGMDEGTYIKLGLANVAEPLYINVGTLVDVYKAKANATQIQIAIDSATREISASIVAGSITATELAKDSVVTEKIADANVTKAKLSAALQASIDKADASAAQTDLESEVTRAKEAEAKALTDAKAYADQSEADAIATAATDATTKAGQALKDAKAYTDEAIGDVDLSGIATNAADIDALEASLAEGGSTYASIANAKSAADAAQADVDALEKVVNGVSEKANANEEAISGHADRLTALEEKVGDGFVAVTTDDIDAMFN